MAFICQGCRTGDSPPPPMETQMTWLSHHYHLVALIATLVVALSVAFSIWPEQILREGRRAVYLARDILHVVAWWAICAPGRLAWWIAGVAKNFRDGLIDLGMYPGVGKRLIDVNEYEAGLAALRVLAARERAREGHLQDRPLPRGLREEGKRIVNDLHRVSSYFETVMPKFVGDPRDQEGSKARRRRLARFIEGLEP